MSGLVDRILSEGFVELSRVEDSLPEGEHERREYVVEARVLKEHNQKIVVIELYTEIENMKNPNEGEECDREEMYRIPFTEDKYFLERMLNLARKHSESYSR